MAHHEEHEAAREDWLESCTNPELLSGKRFLPTEMLGGQ